MTPIQRQTVTTVQSQRIRAQARVAEIDETIKALQAEREKAIADFHTADGALQVLGNAKIMEPPPLAEETVASLEGEAKKPANGAAASPAE